MHWAVLNLKAPGVGGGASPSWGATDLKVCDQNPGESQGQVEVPKQLCMKLFLGFSLQFNT